MTYPESNDHAAFNPVFRFPVGSEFDSFSGFFLLVLPHGQERKVQRLLLVVWEEVRQSTYHLNNNETGFWVIPIGKNGGGKAHLG